MKDPAYYEKIPRKRVHTASLIFNESGQLLLLKPTYKDHWTLSGGVVELEESPLQGCLRETREETGLSFDKAEFLCVQYVKDKDKGDALFFIFHCGILDHNRIPEILLPPDEIADYKFVHTNEVKEFVSEGVFTRITAGLNVLSKAGTGYIER